MTSWLPPTPQLAEVRAQAAAAAPMAAMAALGGVVSTGLDVAVLTVLVESGCAVGPAAWVGTLAGAALAFGWNRRFVFGDRSALRWQQVASFAFVALVGAVALAVSMHLAVSLCGLPYLAAKGLCSVLVFAAWNLPAQRRFVFSPSKPPARSSLQPALQRSLQPSGRSPALPSQFPRSLDAGASSTSF